MAGRIPAARTVPETGAGDPPLDDERLKRIGEFDRTEGVLEVGYFYVPGAIKEPQDERPWFPMLVLAVDHRTGFIFGQEMVRPEELHEGLLDLLLDTLEELGQLPKEILVDSDDAEAVVLAAARRMKIKVRQVDYLEAMEDVRDSLNSYMDGMGI
ncbi:MAG: hypothetical protein KY468_19765 [Armatimonadetes bacterium]|nr:hypothetical protein [Armatimonadota bacterium]